MEKRFPTPSGEASLHGLISSSLEEMHGGEPPFEWKDSDGQLIGCYAPMPYASHIMPHAWSFMKSIYTEATLPARLRQMGILAVASNYQTPYVLYCHERVSRKLGFSESQFKEATSGKTPQGVSEPERIAYETALKLLAKDRRETLSDDSFETARKVLGREGVAGLAHVVAGYQYVCILVSIGGETPVEVMK